jgi:protein-disulfide isomerase
MPFMPTKSTRAKKVVEEPVIEPEFLDEPIQPEEETITFKRSHFFSALAVLTFFVGLFLGYVIWGTNLLAGTKQAGGPVVEASPTQTPKVTRYDIPSDGFYALGPADAPITIVEFSDYQCPYCRRWHDEVYQPLLAAYPGKIKLVYRNLPLTTIHPDSLSAAEAAMCAGEQNAYWPYHEKLFSSDALGNSVYVQYAQELGLDMTSFQACIDEHKYQKDIQADSDFAINLGISSTPTFFINGLAVIGAQPLAVFQQVIDKELAGEIPK